MKKTEFGLKQAEKRWPEVPEIDLLTVPYGNGYLTVAHPSFGSASYNTNLAQMQKTHFHSRNQPEVSFRELTTPESIAAAVYDFGKMAKPHIFDSNWLQIGRIVRTSAGVFANVSKDKQGASITNLKQYLDKSEKFKVRNGHIYLGENDFGFAEYETFAQGVQDCDTFAESGLARVLEHTKNTAQNLRRIASPKFYKLGVNVLGFDSVSEPALRVARLRSDRYIGGGRLNVDGNGWLGYNGFAFGGLKSGEASALKNK